MRPNKKIRKQTIRKKFVKKLEKLHVFTEHSDNFSDMNTIKAGIREKNRN